MRTPRLIRRAPTWLLLSAAVLFGAFVWTEMLLDIAAWATEFLRDFRLCLG